MDTIITYTSQLTLEMPRLGEDNHYAVRTLSSMEKSMWRGSSSIRRGMQPQVGPSSSSQAFGKLQLRLTSLLQPHEQLEPERPRITRGPTRISEFPSQGQSGAEKTHAKLQDACCQLGSDCVTQSSHQEACLSICHKTERREERLMECECNPGSSTLSRH
uniref:Uncharacterized protein n=1 Tax=Rousettus aegyptiacus TaxID=9407 RepID=A0A7J8KB20_ROUAE|nr:hypothetical protein HJG63_007884 [Rousettus aegyptiacus]